MAVIDASDIPSLSLLYKLAKLTAAAPSARPPRTLLGPTSLPTPSKALNDRIALIRGDITTLGVDAIVNAANRSLLGGGGVDGAIHRAAGPGLFDECRKLNGCATGSARITGAYKLPCRRVIHAVGPIYDDEDDAGSERLLASCYTTSLNVAVNNECRTIAFSALSTGIYGYPSRRAAAAALGAIRAFLTSPEAQSKVDKVVLVTFERKDWDAYVEMLPLFFPPVPEHPTGTATETSSAEQKQDVEDEAKLEAEAQAVANELPSPPKMDPDDAEHVDKKQRPNEP